MCLPETPWHLHVHPTQFLRSPTDFPRGGILHRHRRKIRIYDPAIIGESVRRAYRIDPRHCDLHGRTDISRGSSVRSDGNASTMWLCSETSTCGGWNVV